MKTSRLVFRHAAEAAIIRQAARIRLADADALRLAANTGADTAKICSADHLYNDEFMKTSRLIFRQTAATAVIHAEDNSSLHTVQRAPFRCTHFQYQRRVPVSFCFMALHPTELPPPEPPPSEPPPPEPPPFVLLYNSASLILRSTDSLICQSIFLEPSTASSNGILYFHNKILAALANESNFEDPIQDRHSSVQSCSGPTVFLFPRPTQSSLVIELQTYRSPRSASSPTSSNGMTCTSHKVLAAIATESKFGEPVHDRRSSVSSCSRATDFVVFQTNLFFR